MNELSQKAKRNIKIFYISEISRGAIFFQTVVWFSYESGFFGRDMLDGRPEGRAFLSTYQKLGYLISDRLAVLDVKKQVGMYQVELLTGESKIIPIEQNIVDETISYYQGADYLFKNHRNRRDE